MLYEVITKLSSPENQEHLKQEAKNIKERISKLVEQQDEKVQMVRTLAIYSGIMAETLLDYEEPDLVMEQAFHRISDILDTEPYGDEKERNNFV